MSCFPFCVGVFLVSSKSRDVQLLSFPANSPVYNLNCLYLAFFFTSRCKMVCLYYILDISLRLPLPLLLRENFGVIFIFIFTIRLSLNYGVKCPLLRYYYDFFFYHFLIKCFFFMSSQIFNNRYLTFL